MPIRIGKDSCCTYDRSGVEISNLFRVGLMVKRASGSCNRSDCDFIRCNRSVLARGDARQMSDDIRTLKRSIDAEDAERSSEDTTVDSKADEHGITASGDEWVLYQIADIGVDTHITLGYVPLDLAKRFSEWGFCQHGSQSAIWIQRSV